jgi:GH15 family glucan-1,4-alpha-glucosidase
VRIFAIMAAPLEHYGLIGDTETIALVSRSGSIDWLCMPRIDSDACFAQLLGTNRHGYWAVRPTASVRRIDQHYRKDTLILETEFTCEGGKVRVIDFMPTPHQAGLPHDLIRIVEGIEGEVAMRSDLVVRFGYGKLRPWIRGDGNDATLTAGPDAILYHGPIPFTPDWEDGRLEADFTVRAGQRLAFAIEYFASHERPDKITVEAEAALSRTEKFWRDWVAQCKYRGRWRDEVVRSLLTLKACTYRPTGGIVAAPTTSLPEELGGVRNWDYRYCWLRDSTLTLDALLRAGYREEAEAWRDWLMRAAAGSPTEIQIMYGIAGEHRLTEIELPWLPGYEQSRPVRIGNGAYDQFQLDAYGEVVNAFFDSRLKGLPAYPGAADVIYTLVDYVEKVWQRPDEGIWEIRSASKHHFTHSKLLAWVAVDRAIRIYEEFGVGTGHKAEQRMSRWRGLRDAIRNDILERAWNPRRQAFTQSYGSDALDASVLLIPHMGFLPADDRRMLSTVAAIEKDLTWDGLVLRYSTDTGVDGLPGHEATFLICSFWLADNYAMAGRLDEAEALVERLISLATPLGLLAEEYHPGLHRHLGNFPQAFSHIGLVNSACIIEEKRAEREITHPPAMH